MYQRIKSELLDKNPWKNCCYSIYKEKQLMFLLAWFVRQKTYRCSDTCYFSKFCLNSWNKSKI